MKAIVPALFWIGFVACSRPPTRAASSASTAPAPSSDAGAADGADQGFVPRNCAGTMTPELRRAIEEEAAASRTCYEKALRDDPKLTGRIVFNLTFEHGGGISECSVDEDTLKRPDVTQCIQTMFLGKGFDGMPPGSSPEPSAPTGSGWDGGCLQVKLPLNFVPAPTSGTAAPK